MILNADGVAMLVAVDDFGQTSGLNRRPSLSSIHCLHDDHVTAVAAFGEQSAGSGIGFEGRDDLRTYEHTEIGEGQAKRIVLPQLRRRLWRLQYNH
jgi:hypothetical protein